MKQRLFSLDLIRVFAIIGVVSIHSNSIVNRMNYFGGISWWFANLVQSFASISVPLFFMVSGYLLLNPNNIKNNKKRTFTRLIVPLIFWTIVYIPWRYRWHGELPRLADILLFSYSHLYFLTILAILYLFKPHIEKFLANHKKNLGKYILVGFLGSTLVCLFYYLVLNISPSNQALITAPIYIPYFVLGYWIKQNNSGQWWHILPATGIPLLISLTAYFSYQQEITSNSIFILSTGPNYSWEAFNPLVIMSAFFTFTSLHTLTQNFSNKVISQLSKLSYGIYLIHPMLIDLADNYLGLAVHLITHNLWFFYIQKIIIVFIASAISILLLRRNKIFQMLIGESDK